jgi:hypothetical protein
MLLYILYYTRYNWQVWTNFWYEFHIPEQEKNAHLNMCPETFNLWVRAEKSTFITSAQNVLHQIQRTPRHVSSWTAISVQRCRGGCGQSDRHPQCDGEVPLRCQQEPHLGVPTGKTRGFKPVESGGHAVGPPVPINPSWQMLLGTSCTARLKCAATPSCMYHIYADCQC